MKRLSLTLLFVSATSMVAHGVAQSQQPVAVALRHLPPEAARAPAEGYVPALDRFYASREYRPVWTDAVGLTAAGRSVRAALGHAEAEGLEPDDYAIAAIDSRAVRAGQVGELEVLVSISALRFAHDLGWGVTLPSDVDRDHSYDGREFDVGVMIGRMASASDPGAELLSVAPSSPAYVLLRDALGRLRRARVEGGWKTASAGPTLHRGERGPRVAELRSLLVERGDLDAASAAGNLFDDTLAQALIGFQRRHGLVSDGVYGPAVQRELNVPIATRIQQVRLGLERIRWLPPPFTGRRIGVNLADFKVYVLDGQTITFETRAVIGKQYHETPMFSSRMTYVVINPSWNVPPSIARSEILPKAERDAGYLERNHMVVENGAVRQLPGPWNSLGFFKFMFPNAHNVYLHDTPARGLFSEVDRAYSHGCVRVENPAELAAVLLGQQGWTPDRIAETVKTGKETIVNLDTPVPVHITYATAFLDPDGTLHFRPDVYGRDKQLIAALERQGHGSWGQ